MLNNVDATSFNKKPINKLAPLLHIHMFEETIFVLLTTQLNLKKIFNTYLKLEIKYGLIEIRQKYLFQLHQRYKCNRFLIQYIYILYVTNYFVNL